MECDRRLMPTRTPPRCSSRSTLALTLSLHVLAAVYGDVGASEECCFLRAR